MPFYDIKCGACAVTSEVFRTVAERHDLPACGCGGANSIVIRAPMVRSDIEPYQAVATDIATGKPPVIRSRSEHREYLQRNGLVEVGTEKMTPSPRPDDGLDTREQDRARGEAIKQAIEEVGARSA